MFMSSQTIRFWAINGKRCLVPFTILGILSWVGPGNPARAQEEKGLPEVSDVEIQPLLVHVQRLREALEYLGNPLTQQEKSRLEAASLETDPAKASRIIQETLDAHCLASVHINPESRVKVQAGPAPKVLVEQGWRQFLLKVHNEAGVTGQLRSASPQAGPLFNAQANQVKDRWLDMQLFDGRPLEKNLSGSKLEYRIIQLYSRDTGKRSAVLAFDVGQGTQDLGFRADLTLTFDCAASNEVTFQVQDEKGKPVMAGFTIRDRQGRTYPSQAKRLEPDFAFHPQIYRADGESIQLPQGSYNVHITRGPEYLPQDQVLQVGDQPQKLAVKLARWVDPAQRSWWSGDHHIHAAGCAHYNNPTEGVHAPAMMRHCLGEDLKIGANLTWGPCFDYQKSFFTGKDDPVSTYPYILRYDVEVSGFGSHQSGHLVLLRLKNQIPPGGDSKNHWPTLCLNTLRWAKKQGAVVGPAHSGWGLAVNTDKLPTDEVPPFDGIGANEYIVDVTHMVEGPDGKPVPAVDFISTVDTPYVWELNIWYHTLNCNYRTRISGETDFPCIYGERVGLGRSYVKVDGKLTYDDWCEGIRQGRAYVGDGRSHLMDFTVNGLELGTKGSELRLAGPATVKAKALVAAMLPEQPDTEISKRPYTQQPYWHVERARIGESRQVKVELIVNGHAVAEKVITADGKTQEIAFDVPIERSSWVAMRILPSSHTNPVFVLVGDKPIQSRKSAQWCLEGVEKCWAQKQQFIDADEMEDAKAAYEHARKAYRKIIEESPNP